mmetsp:Transcript_3069/g.6374  ORF Transcript_3069/g.6374 Transcript_3069/m.6374 type:complete len:247 (+) Transcript_3069:508-1248(+)
MTGTPASKATWATASLMYSGISRCKSTALALRICLAKLVTSFGQATLEPPTMRMELEPSSSKKINACPDGLSARPEPLISTPLSTRTFSSFPACESLPNWHTNSALRLLPLSRAAATAWLAPLPPGTMMPVSGLLVPNVSPFFGNLEISMMISAFNEPHTSSGFASQSRLFRLPAWLASTATPAAASPAAHHLWPEAQGPSGPTKGGDRRAAVDANPRAKACAGKRDLESMTWDGNRTADAERART